MIRFLANLPGALIALVILALRKVLPGFAAQMDEDDRKTR